LRLVPGHTEFSVEYLPSTVSRVYAGRRVKLIVNSRVMQRLMQRLITFTFYIHLLYLMMLFSLKVYSMKLWNAGVPWVPRREG
jgi:hypothetical protein